MAEVLEAGAGRVDGEIKAAEAVRQLEGFAAHQDFGRAAGRLLTYYQVL